MESSMFSWQRKDFLKLQEIFFESSKLLFIHSKDFESPYHVLHIFLSGLSSQGWMPLYLQPNPLPLSYPFLPFTRAINQAVSNTNKEHHLLPNLIRDFTQSETIASIIENLINNRHRSVILHNKENELFSLIEYATCGYKPIFVFQDYPLFDSASQNLAGLLFSNQIDYDFPFLKEAKYLLLCEENSDDKLNKKIGLIEHIDIHLSSPTLSNAQEIVKEIAPQLSLTKFEGEKVFLLSGGRLSSIEILLRYLSINRQTDLDDIHSDVVQSVIEDRLTKMGKMQNELKSLLSLAANIGNSFSIPLLSRAAGTSNFELLLKKGSEEYLTKREKDMGSFIFREIWYYFYSNINFEQRREIAVNLERAVYYFNPHDYLSRGKYFEIAGQTQEACEMYIYEYHAMFLENIVPENELTDHILYLCEKCGLTGFWSAFQQAHKAFQELRFNECVICLEEMDYPPTLRLLLLKEYLTGISLHKLGKSSDHHEAALNILHSLSQHARPVEEGLWCDCQTNLLSLYVNIGGNINAAKKICRELTYYYTGKSFSPFAQKGLHALERKWSAIYSAERAVIKTMQSVKYFRASRYPAQYLMALNNHAANLIVLGHFHEAQNFLNEATSVLCRVPSLSVNRIYILSNYCLCGVLTRKITAQSACDMLKPIIEGNCSCDWTFIVQLNFSIYKALTGNISEAAHILQRLVHRSIEIKDDYYEFYAYANLASVQFLQGNREEAIEILKNKCMFAPSLCKPTEKQYIEERTTQWISAMQSMDLKTPNDFDNYLLDKHPANTQWSFIGRGFLYSDIQFWAEP